MKQKLVAISDIENEISVELNRNKQNGLQLNTKNLAFILFLKGKEKTWRLKILEHSKMNLIHGGIYNEERNCYYPKDILNDKDIAESNKLEKLFKKWGFQSL